MEYTTIPHAGRPVSRIVLGCSGKLFQEGGDVTPIIDAAREAGINCLDTAREYGASEAAIGRYLRHTDSRDSLTLISKCCHPTLAFLQRVRASAAREDLNRSLDALGTDHIDIYFLHRDDQRVPVEVIGEFMAQFQAEGKIGAFGGSNWTTQRIDAVNRYARSQGLPGFTVSSPHYSLGRQQRDPWGNGCKTITGPANAPQRDYYRQTQMPLFCWSSLCAGMFSGRITPGRRGEVLRQFGFHAAWGYDCPDNHRRLARCQDLAAELNATVSQVALAWLLGSELNTLAIIGGSSPRRIVENAQAAHLTLTPAQREYLNLEREIWA